MARSANRMLALAAATASLLSGLTHAQEATVPIGASSLDQLATDNFLDQTCLANANPDVTGELAAGDTIIVPLECCGTQSFTCGGAFCTAIPACAATQTGAGTIAASASVTEFTASVTGMSGVTGVVPPPADASTTSTSTSTGDDGNPTPVVVVVPVTQSGNTPAGDGTTPSGDGTTPSGDGNTPSGDGTTPAGTEGEQGEESTSTTTTSTATSSTSSTATPAAPKAFMFTTKRDTSRSDFDALVKTVPDGGEGKVIAYDNIPWQSYVSFNLTQAQADEIGKNPLVDLIREVKEDDGEAGVIAAKTPKRQPRIQHQKRADSTRPDSDYHLGILSAPRALRDTQDWPDYEFDTTLGKGQTIYIIDTGYRRTHTEFAATNRVVDEYVVPNEFTIRASPFVRDADTAAPEDMTDHNGHGTKVASVAGGITQGVASQANLKIVKFRNAATDSINGRTQIRGTTDAALRDAWDNSINDIIERQKKEGAGKFIINMSYGFDRDLNPNTLPSMKEFIMERVVPFAAEHDITVTIAAGNDGAIKTLDELTPQSIGTRDNAMITVGGVEKDGSLFIDTVPDVGKGGSLTVYAAARDVACADITGDNDFTTGTGTSLAAPAVAGMAAYFFGIAELNNLWPQGSVARAMKEFYVISASVQRNSNPVPGNLPYDPPSPESIVVAWNRHPEGFQGCGQGSKSKVKRQDGTVPDVSCPAPSDDPEPEPTEPEPTEPTCQENDCTFEYPDGTTCQQKGGKCCAPSSTISCPLRKRDAFLAANPGMRMAAVVEVTA